MPGKELNDLIYEITTRKARIQNICSNTLFLSQFRSTLIHTIILLLQARRTKRSISSISHTMWPQHNLYQVPGVHLLIMEIQVKYLSQFLVSLFWYVSRDFPQFIADLMVICLLVDCISSSFIVFIVLTS